MRLTALANIPEVSSGADLGALILSSIEQSDLQPQAHDVLVVAHKVVSKAESRVVNLDDVVPSDEATDLAQRVNKDPRKMELMLQESAEVMRVRCPQGEGQGLVICRHRLGFICANAGIDDSNVPGSDHVCLLPVDPDRSARALRNVLEKHFTSPIGVVITDTFGRPWRLGLLDVAIGLAGVPARVNLSGTHDYTGRELRVTAPAFADQLAAAAGLLMGKADMIPAVWIQGLDWEESQNSAKDILRCSEEDLFL